MRKYNSTACTVLGFLLEGAKSGWDLAEQIKETIGNFWNVSRSQIYRELRTLEEDGLVTGSRRGARDRRTYKITARGRTIFSDWITKEPGREIYRYPLLLTTWFSDHIPEEQFEWFTRLHRAQHEKQLERYRSVLASMSKGEIDSGPARSLRFSILYEEALITWFDTLPWFAKKHSTASPAPARSAKKKAASRKKISKKKTPRKSKKASSRGGR